jgi:hypothetical protein
MTLISFINGATCMACVVIALFFAQFYRETRDRFFLLFAVAFSLMGGERLTLLTLNRDAEALPFAYVVRCVSFVVIIFAIIDKNRR